MERKSRSVWAVAALLVGALTPGCSSEPAPSIVLFVIDTLRADATSPYGAPVGATPTLDRLAATGVVYERAYANAPWTLPSHGSLFTGKLPNEHGLGVNRLRPAASMEMLAEGLIRAGYQTMGISENPWIGHEFGLTRGFDEFVSAEARVPPDEHASALAGMLKRRDPARPLFLFVNVMDAHEPYEVHEPEPFLGKDPDVDPAVATGLPFGSLFCRPAVPAGTWKTLRALYLGAAARADAKLNTTLLALERERTQRPLIVIVTSDHGQHFGEHDLVGHLYSVRDPVLHVPLVVHGAPRTEPTRVSALTSLIDVHDAILGWARAVPTAAPNPVTSPIVGDASGRAIESQFFDFGETGLADRSPLLLALLSVRRACPAEARVRGHMHAVMRAPFKLIEFADGPAELYDVLNDPREERNLADSHAEDVAALGALRASSEVDAAREEIPAVPPELRERLRALGYVPDHR